MTEENAFPWKLRVLAALAALILRSFALTFRWHRIGEGLNEKHWTFGQPKILVFWHGQQLFAPWLYRLSRNSAQRAQIYALISAHQDGRIAAEAVQKLGIRSIAGSSTSGGMAALRQMARVLRRGEHVAITPDGPKGPAETCKLGAVKLAQLTGAPILPAAVAASHYWRFRSWDKMMLPKPFARVALICGPSFSVPSDANEAQLEAYRERLERELIDLTVQAHEKIASPVRA